MALITLLRHASLPLKYQKRYIGHSDIEIDNSLVNCEKLINLKKQNYDLVYSSDLKRCAQTLDLLELKYITDKRLREVKFKKKIEGKSFSELEKLDIYNSKYLKSPKLWYEFICDEALVSYKSRVESFIKELPKSKNILICCHAGTIRMIKSIIEDIDYEDSYIKVDYLDKIDIII